MSTFDYTHIFTSNQIALTHLMIAHFRILSNAQTASKCRKNGIFSNKKKTKKKNTKNWTKLKMTGSTHAFVNAKYNANSFILLSFHLLLSHKRGVHSKKKKSPFLYLLLANKISPFFRLFYEK